MKRTLLLSIAASLSLCASADLDGTGYYRVHNFKTGRYVSVIDNRGRIDYMNTTADLQAILLQKDFDVVCSDPATVLLITPVQGREYQIEAQGTGIHQIINHYLNLKDAGSSDGQKLYNAYGEMDGVIKYIGDGQFLDFMEYGSMVTHAKGDYNKWFITPIEATSDNFFGVQPTFEANGKYYTTMYTSFPFSPYSEGIKTYYLKNHYDGMLLLEKIEGTVPAGTPVLIECSTDLPTTNRLNVGGTAEAISGNKLKGVYFCSSVGGHVNRLEYNKETMRVLGLCSDGAIGFVKDEELDYIPANKCYITVSKGSPDEYKIVTPEEFEADVYELRVDDGDAPKDVYDLQGRLVLRKAYPEDINDLQPGIYISGRKKYVVR